jgi:hypothetical protein
VHAAILHPGTELRVTRPLTCLAGASQKPISTSDRSMIPQQCVRGCGSDTNRTMRCKLMKRKSCRPISVGVKHGLQSKLGRNHGRSEMCNTQTHWHIHSHFLLKWLPYDLNKTVCQDAYPIANIAHIAHLKHKRTAHYRTQYLHAANTHCSCTHRTLNTAWHRFPTANTASHAIARL